MGVKLDRLFPLYYLKLVNRKCFSIYIFRMSDTVTVQQLKHAFVIQLSPQASQIERTNSFNLIQSFKSSPTRDQVKVIFELITDADSE